MSGYLERIVEAARTSSPIRPMAGSIFAGPRQRWAPRPFEQVEEIAAESRPQPFAGPMPESPRRSGTKPETARADFTGQPVPSRTPAHRDAASLGQDALRAERMPSRWLPAEIQPRPANPAGLTFAVGQQPARTGEPPHAAEPAAREVIIERLPRPAAAANPRPEATNFPPPAGSAVGRREGGSFSAAKGAPAREPDEIQIHIGRIEVTAAPPPVVRPSPKPLHKSPDLGAYLNRRGGGER